MAKLLPFGHAAGRIPLLSEPIRHTLVPAFLPHQGDIVRKRTTGAGGIAALQDVSANSWEVGVIGGIDRCLDELFGAHGIDGQRLSFERKESAKVALYSGGAYAIPNGRTRLGESDGDKAIVESAIDGYCHKAWSNIRVHCQESEVVVLTGGGTCIPRVREYFEDKLRRAGVANIVVFSVSNTSELAKRGNRLCDWQSTGEGLGRLATALGGVSIAYGFRPDKDCLRRQHLLAGSMSGLAYANPKIVDKNSNAT